MRRSTSITVALLSFIPLACGISSSCRATALVGDAKSTAYVKRRRRRSPSQHHDATNYGGESIAIQSTRTSPLTHDAPTTYVVSPRGGEVIASKPPSIYWAIFHNWLYFMSLGFNLINIQFLVREIVDGDAKAKPSAKSIALSGKVESVDKLLTFLGIGFLSALSDKLGRKPLM